MNENFDASLAWLLKTEGGWSDEPDDKPTMRGVTLTTFRAYIKPNATKEDLKRITSSQIRTIYKRHFWDPVMGDDLPAGIDYAVFDFAVNSGVSRAAKKLQEVLGVPVDGRIGPKTLAASGLMLPRTLIVLYQQRRLAYLRTLKKWKKYGKGWTARLARVQDQAIRLSETSFTLTAAKTAPVSRWGFLKAFIRGEF